MSGALALIEPKLNIAKTELESLCEILKVTIQANGPPMGRERAVPWEPGEIRGTSQAERLELDVGSRVYHDARPDRSQTLCRKLLPVCRL
jgi:hypothetical protein